MPDVLIFLLLQASSLRAGSSTLAPVASARMEIDAPRRADACACRIAHQAYAGRILSRFISVRGGGAAAIELFTVHRSSVPG